MADIFPRYSVRRYALVGGQNPVSVCAPIACTYVAWRNRGRKGGTPEQQISVSLSTPPFDDTAFDTIEPGEQGVILAPPAGPKELNARFQQGDELFRLKLDSDNSSDTGIMVVQFVF